MEQGSRPKPDSGSPPRALGIGLQRMFDGYPTPTSDGPATQGNVMEIW
jgi:hypothetical protein